VRYIGIVLIALTFGGIGAVAAARVGKRCSSLSNILSFLKMFKVELRCSMSETELLVYSAAETMEQPPCFVEDFRLFAAEGESLPNAWRSAVMKRRQELCLKRNEMDAVLQLGGIFGSYDAAGQTAAIDAAEIRLEEMYSSAQKECAQKVRLYRTLGMLGGAAAAIILV